MNLTMNNEQNMEKNVFKVFYFFVLILYDIF
jgi:hypothetical protein